MLHFKREVLGDSGARVLPMLRGGRWAVCCRVWTWNSAVCVPGTENVGIRVTSKVNYSLTYRCPCLPGPLGHPTCHLRPWAPPHRSLCPPLPAPPIISGLGTILILRLWFPFQLPSPPTPAVPSPPSPCPSSLSGPTRWGCQEWEVAHR